MSKKGKHLTVELSQKEAENLLQYCKQEKRTQSDVVREFIRGLEGRIIIRS